MLEEHAVYGRIYSPGEKPFKGTVLVENGIITDVIKKRSFPAGYERHVAKAVFPGFCNAHVHAHMYSFMGLGIGKKYPDYFRQLFLLEKQITRRELYNNVRRMAGMMLREGVIRACNMSLDAKPVARGYLDSGMRARLAIAVKNRRTLRENERLFRILGKGSRAVPDFGIANERETSEELIRRIVSLAEKKEAGIQVHVAEAPASENSFKGTSVLFLDNLGVFSEKTIAVHCTYTTARDVYTLRDRRSWITVCPVANQNVRSRTPPIHLIERIEGKNKRLAVGTDEPVINESVSLHAEARFLHKIKNNGTSRVFEMLCAPGLIPLTGKIKPGWHADLVMSEAAGLKELVFGDRKVSHVMVEGQLIF